MQPSSPLSRSVFLLVCVLVLAGNAWAACGDGTWDYGERCNTCPEDVGQSCLSFVVNVVPNKDLITPGTTTGDDLKVTIYIADNDPHPDPSTTDQIDLLRVSIKDGATNEPTSILPVVVADVAPRVDGTIPNCSPSCTFLNTLDNRAESPACPPSSPVGISGFTPCILVKTVSFADLSPLPPGSYVIEAVILSYQDQGGGLPGEREIARGYGTFTIGGYKSISVDETPPWLFVLTLLGILFLLRRS